MELEPLDANALLTTSGLYCDCGYWSDRDPTSSVTTPSTLERTRSHHAVGSPAHLTRSASDSTLQFSTSPARARSAGKKRMIMDDADKGIYNSMGSSSAPSGKVQHGSARWSVWLSVLCFAAHLQ